MASKLVRVAVQSLKKEAILIREVPETRTAFDIFGSNLPDEVFEGVFNQPRQQNWREADL
jgi:hypothetical protein